MKNWKILSSKRLVDNPWLRINQEKVQLPNGMILEDYYVIEEDDVVIIVPYLDNGHLALVKQYKHGIQKEVIEFPAGYIDKEADPRKAALRELQEETGLKPKKIEQIAILTNNPTKIRSRIFVYRASGCTKTYSTDFDVSEDVEMITKPKSEVLKMIRDGRIWVTGSVSAGLLELA